MENNFKYQLVVLILSSVLKRSQEHACPGLPKCVCNKELTFVDCKGKHLTSIPKLPVAVVKLHLGFNNLTNIPSRAFSGLSKLQRLYIDNNQIKNIEPFAFHSMVNLIYLNLRMNEISLLGNNSFAYIPRLKELILMDNNIQYIDENAFEETSSIRYINIAENHLSAVPNLGYQPSLSRIYLSGNLIVNATFPSSFSTISQRIALIGLARNKIKSLKNITFASLANKSISKLYFSQNNITFVDIDAFAGFISIATLKFDHNPMKVLSLKNITLGLAEKSLQYLDLSEICHSDLMIQYPLTFFPNSTLKPLILRHNGCLLLRNNLFSQLKQLSELDLSSNQLSSTQTKSFNGLDILETLNLDYNFFKSIPKNLPSSLQSLYLNNNLISEIKGNDFIHFYGLKVLRLINNNIATLEQDAFKGLVNLKELTLTDNHMRYLPRTIFTDLRLLTHLDLSKNYLHKIDFVKNRFEPLVSLRFLSLADNQCSYFQEDILKPLKSLQFLYLQGNKLANLFSGKYGGLLFEGLKNLEVLNIASNNIKTLQKSVFQDLASLKFLKANNNKLSKWGSNIFGFTKNLIKLDLSHNMIPVLNSENLRDLNVLRYLYLNDNPFICNCDLLWFRDWIDSTNIVLPNNLSYTCHGPREWQGKPLLEFSKSKISCLFFTKNGIAGAVVAGLLISSCLGVFVYKIRWRLRLRLYMLSKRGRQFIRYLTVNDRRSHNGAIQNHEEYFDGYISCSENDKTWVLNHLLPGIDNGQLNDDNKFEGDFRLYFDDRDSEAGASYVANIVEHMSKSRNVIVVLSRHYFNGMNEFELDQATALLHDDEIEDIIVIKLGNVPARNVPAHLYTHMRNGMFIEWEDDENAIHTFREKLIDRLQETPETAC